ncbi:hypothetical protein RSAG8_13788, partial [Rhizoctonia solani AG-8 WAC10335]
MSEDIPSESTTIFSNRVKENLSNKLQTEIQDYDSKIVSFD